MFRSGTQRSLLLRNLKLTKCFQFNIRHEAGGEKSINNDSAVGLFVSDFTVQATDGAAVPLLTDRRSHTSTRLL